jgi:hypothetical protein
VLIDLHAGQPTQHQPSSQLQPGSFKSCPAAQPPTQQHSTTTTRHQQRQNTVYIPAGTPQLCAAACAPSHRRVPACQPDKPSPPPCHRMPYLTLTISHNTHADICTHGICLWFECTLTVFQSVRWLWQRCVPYTTDSLTQTLCFNLTASLC